MQLEDIENWAKLGFMWIGFGTVVGLAAKAIMPGRDPGGSIATLLMGIGGTVIGCALLKFFYPNVEVSPISSLGFAVGTGGAFLILTFYKVLGGYWFTEGETAAYAPRRRARRRRTQEAIYEE
ncbi:MAG: GlsB/YeaQ/YmgE family stress response membrane protein [Pirellulaceae bacterium]|nr:GlsB/YeaQ/YmgE family stress response membrane protein [Planctomycetales bacterium]